MKKLKYKLSAAVLLLVLGIIAPANANTPTKPNIEAQQNKPIVETKNVREGNNGGAATASKGLPVLPKILLAAGGCESGHSPNDVPKQRDANGRVIRHANRDGTTDWGAFQINSIHDKDAKRLGLDYKYSEIDNYKMALWIYRTQGIGAWFGYNPKTNNCTYYE